MGTSYEVGLIGFLAVQLSNVKAVEDYLIYSCESSPEICHDIIARVKLKGVWYLLLIQTRYDDGSNSEDSREIPDLHRDILNENIRYIIFCNSNLEDAVSPRKEYLEGVSIDEIILLFGANYRKIDCNFYLFLKQFDRLNINAEIAKYLTDYFNDKYLRNQGLNKDIFEMETRKIHLANFIVHPRLSFTLVDDVRIDIWNKIATTNGIIFVNNDGDDDIVGCLYRCCVKRIDDLFKIKIDWDIYVERDQILPEIIAEKFREYSKTKAWRSWIHPPVDLKSLLINLWKYGDLPLILRSNIDSSIVTNCIVVNDSVSSTAINEIKNESLRGDILENTPISLQGRQEMTLDELIGKEEILLRTITVKDIIRLMCLPIPIIGRQIYYDKLDYIPRSLQIPSINNSYFNREETKICLLSGDVDTLYENIDFLMTENLDDIEKFLLEPKCYFIKIGVNEREDYWSKLSSLGYPILDFHIRYGIMEVLRYQNCDIKDLKSYFWYFKLPEGYFFENLSDMDKIVVITGDPGAGKTSFLKSLCDKSTTRNYIIYYDLKQIQNDMPEPIKNITMDLILEQFHKDPRPEFYKFIQDLCHGERLILILDSFDEIIDTSYEEEIIKFLRCCNHIQIIIASRLAGLNLLKTCFNLQAIKLDSLDESDVRKYAAKLELKKDILQGPPDDFKTNPSHLNYLKILSEENLDTLSLYEKVIDIKIKNSITIDEIKTLFERLALTAVFGVDQIKKRFNWVNTERISAILKYGIVINFDKSNLIPEFYGFTLEFFISRWFINAIQTRENKSLIKDLYKQMFDEGNLNLLNLTCEDLNLHKAIVRNDMYEVVDLCQDDRNSLNTPDKLGRLAIHVATIRCRHERRSTPYFILGEIIRSMQRYNYDSEQLDGILRLDWVAHMSIDMFERIFYYDYIEIIRAYLNYARRHPTSTHLLPQFLEKFFREAFLMGLKHFSIDIIYDLIFLQTNDNTTRLKPLHIACLNGNITTVEKLIELNSEINSLDDFHYTPLDYSTFYACTQIKSSYKMILLEEDESAPPPIYKQNQHIKLLELLLKNGADVDPQQNNIPEHYHTPLCVAARSGYLDAVKLLLKTKIRNQLCGEDCRIRLHIAAITQNFDLINLLIRDDTMLNIYDDYQNAPLQYAVETDNVEIVKLLLNIRLDINTRNKSYETSLHRAVKKKNIDIIEALLKAGANPNLQNRRGETPLHYAVRLKNEKIKDKIQIIIDESLTYIESECGDIPLYTAEKMPTADKTRLSLIMGGTMNSKDKIFYDSNEKIMDIIKMLVQAGGDCKIRNMNRITPLDYVTEMRDEDTIKLFIKRKKRHKRN